MTNPVGSAMSVVLVWRLRRWISWQDAYKILKEDGFDVTIVQNPTTSLAADVAATKLVLATQKLPVILVGHSYRWRGDHGSWKRSQGESARLCRAFADKENR
jgi:hypothetical protein